jgi:rare lipoprotein A (peptidoglycan hydrolase)
MVESLETGEKVEVKITDRGPYADTKRRIIDLSRAAADSSGLVKQGSWTGTSNGDRKARRGAEDQCR